MSSSAETGALIDPPASGNAPAVRLQKGRRRMLLKIPMWQRLTRRRLVTTAAVIGVVAALSIVPMAVTGVSASAATPVHVYIAGDSTASTYVSSLAPRAGWGQALPVFLTSNAVAVNVAKSGASSKSFIDLGRLDHILALLKRGDYLLISFGHNDEKIDDPTRYTEPSTTYKSYLSQYIDKSRAKGAIPILITPVERRHFTSAGVISPSHGAYPAAMRELAAAKGVPLIDLTASSTALWNRAGVEGTKKYFLILAAGQYPNYPNGIQDNTHFQAFGAIEVARLVATALRNQGVLPSADFRQLTATIPTSAIVWPTTAPY
jgi:lysophospholipase L1-like esterase